MVEFLQNCLELAVFLVVATVAYFFALAICYGIVLLFERLLADAFATAIRIVLIVYILAALGSACFVLPSVWSTFRQRGLQLGPDLEGVANAIIAVFTIPTLIFDILYRMNEEYFKSLFSKKPTGTEVPVDS